MRVKDHVLTDEIISHGFDFNRGSVRYFRLVENICIDRARVIVGSSLRNPGVISRPLVTCRCPGSRHGGYFRPDFSLDTATIIHRWDRRRFGEHSIVVLADIGFRLRYLLRLMRFVLNRFHNLNIAGGLIGIDPALWLGFPDLGFDHLRGYPKPGIRDFSYILVIIGNVIMGRFNNRHGLRMINQQLFCLELRQRARQTAQISNIGFWFLECLEFMH